MLLYLLVKLYFMIAVEEIIKEKLFVFVCVFTVSLNCNFVLIHRANITHTCLSF